MKIPRDFNSLYQKNHRKQKNQKAKKLSLVQSLSWIIGSSVIIVGFAHILLRHYLQAEIEKEKDPAYFIKAIIQTGPQKEALKTDYFAELLDISCDYSQPLSKFDLNLAKTKILQSPVIKTVEVKKLPPYTLYIEYCARQPLAWLADYKNIAIDQEGYFFPVYPFFTPKNLPEIYLGIEFTFEKEKAWHISLNDPHLSLAFCLLKLIEETKMAELTEIKKIDVSNAFAESYGNREIILICQDKIDPYIHTRLLRLSTKNYSQELGNFLKLREQLLQKESFSDSTCKVIDLRLSKLGFIEELY